MLTSDYATFFNFLTLSLEILFTALRSQTPSTPADVTVLDCNALCSCRRYQSFGVGPVDKGNVFLQHLHCRDNRKSHTDYLSFSLTVRGHVSHHKSNK